MAVNDVKHQTIKNVLEMWFARRRRAIDYRAAAEASWLRWVINAQLWWVIAGLETSRLLLALGCIFPPRTWREHRISNPPALYVHVCVAVRVFLWFTAIVEISARVCCQHSVERRLATSTRVAVRVGILFGVIHPARSWGPQELTCKQWDYDRSHPSLRGSRFAAVYGKAE